MSNQHASKPLLYNSNNGKLLPNDKEYNESNTTTIKIINKTATYQTSYQINDEENNTIINVTPKNLTIKKSKYESDVFLSISICCCVITVIVCLFYIAFIFINSNSK